MRGSPAARIAARHSSALAPGPAAEPSGPRTASRSWPGRRRRREAPASGARRRAACQVEAGEPRGELGVDVAETRGGGERTADGAREAVVAIEDRVGGRHAGVAVGQDLLEPRDAVLDLLTLGGQVLERFLRDPLGGGIAGVDGGRAPWRTRAERRTAVSSASAVERALPASRCAALWSVTERSQPSK